MVMVFQKLILSVTLLMVVDANHYTTHSHECVSDCITRPDDNHYWCYTNHGILWSSWDYCSPRKDYTINNEPCRSDDRCTKGTGGRRQDYYWCYTDSNNNWDYCGPVD